MLLLEDKSGLIIVDDKEREWLKKQYETTIEEIVNCKRLDYECELKHGDAVFFLDSIYEKYRYPLEVITMFIEEGDLYGYTTRLIVNGHWTVLELTYEDGSKKYIYNDREAWPQIFEEGIEYEGDLLFCATEEGFTKEDCFNYLRDYAKVNFGYKYDLKKENLIIMTGL